MRFSWARSVNAANRAIKSSAFSFIEFSGAHQFQIDRRDPGEQAQQAVELADAGAHGAELALAHIVLSLAALGAPVSGLRWRFPCWNTSLVDPPG